MVAGAGQSDPAPTPESGGCFGAAACGCEAQRSVAEPCPRTLRWCRWRRAPTAPGTRLLSARRNRGPPRVRILPALLRVSLAAPAAGQRQSLGPPAAAGPLWLAGWRRPAARSGALGRGQEGQPVPAWLGGVTGDRERILELVVCWPCSFRPYTSLPCSLLRLRGEPTA